MPHLLPRTGALAVLLAIAAGCAHPAVRASPFGDLDFADATLRERLVTLREDALHDAANARRGGKPWSYEPGSSLPAGGREAWCVGWTGAAGCWGHKEERGAAWRVLDWERSPEGGAVTAVALAAGSFPPDGAWGVSVEARWATVAEGDATDAWTLVLVRFSEGMITNRIALGRTTRFQVEQTAFSFPPAPDAPPAAAELETIATSVPAFQSWTSRLLARMAADVDAAFARGEVERCAYGRYDGWGNPRCELVPLPPAEAAGQRAVVASDFARQARLLEEGAPEIVGLLADLLAVTSAR